MAGLIVFAAAHFAEYVETLPDHERKLFIAGA